MRGIIRYLTRANYLRALVIDALRWPETAPRTSAPKGWTDRGVTP